MKWFLTGIGLGTAIGVLVAPETGAETRKTLMTRAAEFARSVEKTLERKSDNIHDQPQGEVAEENTARPEMQSDGEGQTSPDPVAEVINTASKTQLRKVPGIGDATARRIIENRPFESEAEIVESKVMSDGVLKKLKNKLVDTDEDIA